MKMKDAQASLCLKNIEENSRSKKEAKKEESKLSKESKERGEEKER